MENKLKKMILYFMALFTNLDNSISSFSTKKKRRCNLNKVLSYELDHEFVIILKFNLIYQWIKH